MLTGLEEVADFQIIREWEKTTEIGDRAEIKTLPEISTAWAKVDARSELCTGQKCRQFRALLHHPDAPAGRRERHHHRQPPPVLRRPLAASDENYEGGILPDYHAVVFDEAHEIEDVAGQYFGVSRQQLPVPGPAARHRAWSAG